MNYGKHFNSKMCRFAVSCMRDRDGKPLEPMSREDVQAKLKEQGVELDNDVMHDAVYAYQMAKSDYMGSSVEDEKHLCLSVKDIIDDPDQSDGYLFARFASDCINNGTPIDWAEML